MKAREIVTAGNVLALLATDSDLFLSIAYASLSTPTRVISEYRAESKGVAQNNPLLNGQQMIR